MLNLLLIVVMFSSCVPKRKLVLLQKEDDLNLKGSYYNIPPSQELRPHDNVYVKVLSLDPEIRELFRSEASSFGSESDLVFYELSDSGYVDFPFAGKIRIEGMTADQAKSEIYRVLKEYLPGKFALHVKMAHTRVAVLGEVRNPGTFNYYKEPLSVLQAIGMAGGAEVYANLEEVLIIRKINNQITHNIIDLTRKDAVGSEFFYLKPDDTIYLKPVRARFNNLGPINYSNFLATITTALTVIVFMNQLSI